jgi:hypothetical protein
MLMKKAPKRRKRRIRQVAVVKSTGGGGFAFADKGGGDFLAEVLRGGTPLGGVAGALVGVHFEARESGWVLDDLVLVAKNGRKPF